MDTNAYLQRIGYTGPLEPGPCTLSALQRFHLDAVPFENLDIHLKVPISLEPQDLFDKIVTRRRGGFCYELNGLFALLLKELGYGITYLSARAAHKDGGFGREFDHLVLLVDIPSTPAIQRLVDVGWGDSSITPLDPASRAEQRDGIRSYRLQDEGMLVVLSQQEAGGEWTRQYGFTLLPRTFPSDYLGMCRYHQTSPESSFTRGRVITLPTAEGRVTLTDTRLILTRGGRREEIPVQDEAHFRLLLKQYFYIQLP